MRWNCRDHLYVRTFQSQIGTDAKYQVSLTTPNSGQARDITQYQTCLDEQKYHLQPKGSPSRLALHHIAAVGTENIKLFLHFHCLYTNE